MHVGISLVIFPAPKCFYIISPRPHPANGSEGPYQRSPRPFKARRLHMAENVGHSKKTMVRKGRVGEALPLGGFSGISL